MAGKTFGPKFQDHIVACAVRVPQFAARVQHIFDPEYIEDGEMSSLLDYSLQSFRDHKVLPTQPTLSEHFSESLLGPVFSENITDYPLVMAKVVDFCTNAALKGAILNSARKINAGNSDGIIEEIRDALMVGEDFAEMGAFYEDTFEERMAEYLYPDLVKRIPTGFAELDRLMGGGQEPGELGCVIAPPKRGKSHVLVNIGFGSICALNGYNVIHYSLEMSRNRVLRRYDMRMAGIGGVELAKRDPAAFIELLRFRKRRLKRGRLLVKAYPTRFAAASNLRSHLQQCIAAGFVPDVIIVDYADILRAERRLGEHRHEQASCYEDLRALAGEFELSVWTACQSNKEGLRREVIDIDNMAESFEKAAICDNIIAYCETPQEEQAGRFRFFLAAIRNEKSGKIIPCGIDKARSFIWTEGKAQLQEEKPKRKSKKKRRSGKAMRASSSRRRRAS